MPNNRSVLPVYHSLSDAYLGIKNYEKAEIYLDSILNYSPSADNLIRVYDAKIFIATQEKNVQKFENYIRTYDSLNLITNLDQFKCMTNHYKAVFAHEIKDIKEFNQYAYDSYQCLKNKKDFTRSIDLGERIISSKLNNLDAKIFLEIIEYTDSLQKKSLYNRINKSELDLYNEINNIENENEKVILKNIENQNIIASIKIKNQKNRISLLILSLLILLSGILYYLWNQNRLKKLNNSLNIQKDQIKLLNQELNHRVKNNLTFMTSLLEMQARRISNFEAKEIIKESESRLKTLSLIHSNLFKNENDTEVNLKFYLSEIVNHLQSLFQLNDKDLVINTEFIDYKINAEDAMRLGLIVNELITNSIKHAFDDVKNPIINISTSINIEKKLTLNYKDNGQGLQINTMDSKNTHSLGIKLISLLKEQLGDRFVFMFY